MEDDFNPEVMNVLTELDTLKQFREISGFEPGKADKYGFSYEPCDSFSMEPLIFAETGMRLETEAVQTFMMIRKLNRCSPVYVKMSRLLEKMIGLLGRCCITKAVLEKQGCQFPMLENICIDHLRGMTAFSFRKAWSAYMVGVARYTYMEDFLDLSIRWAALDGRLKSTQEKIEKIRTGEIKVDTGSNRKEAAPEKNTGQKEKKDVLGKDPAPFAPRERAFSADKAVIRAFEEKKAAEQPAEAVPADPELSEDALEGSPMVRETAAEKGNASPDADNAVPGSDPDDDEYREKVWDAPSVSEELAERMANYYQRQAMVPVMDEWDAPP